VEIYPRLFTGPVVKSDSAARAYGLDNLDWGDLDVPSDVRAAAAGSEDAYDALVSVVRMWGRRNELRSLGSSLEAEVQLEGWVFGATPNRDAPSLAQSPASRPHCL
jgi:hypothetical protein